MNVLKINKEIIKIKTFHLRKTFYDQHYIMYSSGSRGEKSRSIHKSQMRVFNVSHCEIILNHNKM